MHELTEQTLLARLAERAGIATDYHDIAGTLHLTSDDTKTVVFTAMGFAIDSPASLIQALRSEARPVGKAGRSRVPTNH